MTASRPLEDRVTSLEYEVSQLRRRLASLESDRVVSPPAPPKCPSPSPERVVRPRVDPTPPPSTPTPAPALAAPPRLPDAAPAPEPEEPSFLHELLETLQLIPPRSGSSGEAQLGAWWATRIGALLAVIGVVFFGIYLSTHTTPLVRWVELAAITLGCAAAGVVFERRRLRIGPVVVGAALALTYFTAFAAYAVPAVKVTDSILIAALLQTGAVITIGVTALRRHSPTIGLMAIVLGFVSTFASLEAGLGPVAAVAGLGLSVAAITTQRVRGWMGPAFASAVLAPLLNLVLAPLVWKQPLTFSDQALPFVFITLGFAVHLFPLLGSRGTHTTLRALQATQTAMHVLAGLVTTQVLFGTDALAVYFFAAGGVLTLVTAWIWQTRPEDRLFGMFAVKASSLLALGVIAEWDARTRWVALLVEAFVLLAAAQRTRRLSLVVMSAVVWAVSLVFYGLELPGFAEPLASPTGAAMALYVIAGVMFHALLGKAFRLVAQPGESLMVALAAAAAIPVQLAASAGMKEAWFAVAAVTLMAAMEGIRRWQRSIVPLPALAVLAINAHIALQAYQESQWHPVWLWSGALALAVGSFIAITKTVRLEKSHVIGVSLALLGHAALAGALLQSLPLKPAFMLVTLLAVGLAWTGRRIQRNDLLVAGPLALTTGAALAVFHTLTSSLPSAHATWMAIAALGVPALWAITAGRRTSDLRTAQWLAAVAGVFIIWMPLTDLTSATWRGLATAGIVLLLTLQARLIDLRPARLVAGALAVLGAIEVCFEIHWPSHPHPYFALFGAITIGLTIASIPLWWNRNHNQRSDGWCTTLGVLGALVVSRIALAHHAPWQDYGSGLWALGGLAVFTLGLLFRARSHRLIGLALIALCIPRVFVHDINDAKHRIIAFILLGVLLIWVGFSYQRFRHFIEDRDPDESERA